MVDELVVPEVGKAGGGRCRFGIGAGLTIDEFALGVYLDDVYWAKEGLSSTRVSETSHTSGECGGRRRRD